MELNFREALPQDGESLFSLFAATHGGILSGVPEPVRSQLLAMQWRSRCQTYASMEGHVAWVVEREGVLVGSFDLATDQLVDIRVDPGCQGQGIGAAILERIKEGRSILRLQVALGNPALRLYERAGFQVESQGDSNLNLVWRRT